MSLISRAKLSAGRRIFSLYPVTLLQQLYLYSTETTHATPKTQRSTNPKTQKSPEPSSSFSEGIKKRNGQQIVCPKPREIPYQAKVANFVSLVGYVRTPVHFEAAADGNHFAAAVISQEIGWEKESLLIPVVFGGDLAHVVACHVKENHCVLVSGQLSAAPMQRIALSDGLGKFHVVAENLNFVEGYNRRDSRKKLRVSISGVGAEKSGDGKIDEIKSVDDDDVEEEDEEFNQRWNDAIKHAKLKRISGANDWVLSCVNPQLSGDSEAPGLEFERESGKCSEDSGESGIRKKDRNRTLDLWRDFVKNSLLWRDFRDHKSKGLVKEKFPDFKHKHTGDGLWLSSAPDWVWSCVNPQLSGDSEAAGLEFKRELGKCSEDNGESGIRKKDHNRTQDNGESGIRKKDHDRTLDLWRDLVKNSPLWWDFRDHKSKGLVKEKFPDFKHKHTGDGLWLSSAPDWVLPGLGKLEFDVKVIKVTQVQGDEGAGGRKRDVNDEDSWKNLVENPGKWWDNRLNKHSSKLPDFRHKETGEGLWVDKSPAWVLSRLPPLKDGQNTIYARRVHEASTELP